jgi:hypothetical protein
VATSRFSLPQFQATDTVNRLDFNAAFSAIDDSVPGSGQGTASLSTANGQVPLRSFYYNTSTGVLSYKYGDGTWRTVFTTNKVGNGLAVSSDQIAVDAGDGLGFSGTALKVNTGATTDISSDAIIVKSGSLTQTQATSTYRFTRTGEPSTDVAQGDLSTNTSNELKVRNGSSAWQKPANLPWGLVAMKVMPGGSAGNGTTTMARGVDTDVAWNSETMQVTADLLSTRAYRITALVPEVQCSVAGSVIQLRLLGNGTSYGRTLHHAAIGGQSFSATTDIIVSGLASQSWTWKASITLLTVTNDNNFSIFSMGSTANLSRSYISIEDIGPSV